VIQAADVLATVGRYGIRLNHPGALPSISFRRASHFFRKLNKTKTHLSASGDLFSEEANRHPPRLAVVQTFSSVSPA